MQVAQILQVLVVSKREDIDPKVSDLYSKFQVRSIKEMFMISFPVMRFLESFFEHFPLKMHLRFAG